MSHDFWDAVSDAGVDKDPDGSPRFHVNMRGRTIHVYLSEGVTRKQALRKFFEGMASFNQKEDKVIVERIVDDLFAKFGVNGVLEWDQSVGDQVNREWVVRMLRRDLKRRGLPRALPREAVEGVLDELYVVEPVIDS